MDFVLTTGTAATAAMLLVAMFKLALPTVPSWGVVMTSLVPGIGLTLLVAVAQGDPMTA